MEEVEIREHSQSLVVLGDFLFDLGLDFLQVCFVSVP